jgi:uncharacterized protein (DUF1501 family)
MSQLAQQSPSGQPPYKTKLYSTGGERILTGDRRPISLGSNGDIPSLSQHAALEAAITNLTTHISGSVFAETYAGTLDDSVRDSNTVRSALSRSTTHSFGRGKLDRQMQSIAKIINARKDLGAERDAFSAVLGGYDTHHNQMYPWHVGSPDAALLALETELKTVDAEGDRAWDHVTIVVASEFGRSIVSNGVGSDHGWGGHSFVMGGAVRGGRILGQYPADFDHQISPPNRRGRIIPTTSWESVWHAIGQWLGVEDAAMQRALPGMHNFDCNRVGPDGNSNTPGCGLMSMHEMFQPENNA